MFATKTNCHIEPVNLFCKHFLKVMTMSSNRYVSCVLGCPYEGHIEPYKVAEVRKPKANPAASLLSLFC